MGPEPGLEDEAPTQEEVVRLLSQLHAVDALQVINQLAREKFTIRGDVDVHEDWSHVNVMLTEAANQQGAVSKSLGTRPGAQVGEPAPEADGDEGEDAKHHCAGGEPDLIGNHPDRA